MKKILKFTMFSAVLLSLIIAQTSCQKELSPSQFGVYAQIYPEGGNLKIEFVDKDRLFIIEPPYYSEWTSFPGSRIEYKYEIKGKKIKLTAASGSFEGETIETYFYWINKRKFEIKIHPSRAWVFEKE
jgi:hypothetical protein